MNPKTKAIIVEHCERAVKELEEARSLLKAEGQSARASDISEALEYVRDAYRM